MIRPELIKAIDAVTATTVSEPINIENAEKISLIFTRANHSAGSSAFSVEVSLDGSTYVAFNKLISNATNTNAQTKTRVASVSLASNTSSIVAMDLENDIFRWMRITATETTDGTHTAKALIQRHA
jgi:hypothetical protein